MFDDRVTFEIAPGLSWSIAVDPYLGNLVVVGDFNGNADLVSPSGPLSDSWQGARDVHHIMTLADGTDHCGDRIDLILPRPPIVVLAYDGTYGGGEPPGCSPRGLSDHPLVQATLLLSP